MQMVLEERELWEVTSGEVKLEHCTTTADQATFKRKSRKALAIICLAMEDSQLPLVRSAKDAHDAWSRLEGHFEKKSLANKLFLRRRFFTTMMDEGDDVLEHINKLKTLAEQLDAVGAPVSEDVVERDHEIADAIATHQRLPGLPTVGGGTPLIRRILTLQLTLCTRRLGRVTLFR
ncbi:Retrovirus-related Pol polyprotein from transposon TNT 1-94 [Phytophthora ramorum]|uniref:Retrovirus-related Pol polyprotein from transposon TNT 1-94 n=1 Tax=Phytophthora ramorum TaxID=164328 RepID=UPI00309D8396|nr:Retrovirus-related Pol polyprotein from transposon TNT 1-94 [Phytophthora ramorum]